MPRELQPHGTEAAYRRHLRHAETPCEDCKRAAARRRAERRGVEKPEAANTKMRDLITAVVDQIIRDADGQIDYTREYERLYSYLNHALPEAMPREVASIVKEMRSILLDIRTLEVKDGAGSAADLEEEFRRAMAAVNGGGTDDDDGGDLD